MEDIAALAGGSVDGTGLEREAHSSLVRPGLLCEGN